MADEDFTFESRLEIARRHVMKMAREMDERGDMATHAYLMTVALGLRDVETSASAYDFKKGMVDNQLRAVPTPWRRR